MPSPHRSRSGSRPSRDGSGSPRTRSGSGSSYESESPDHSRRRSKSRSADCSRRSKRPRSESPNHSRRRSRSGSPDCSRRSRKHRTDYPLVSYGQDLAPHASKGGRDTSSDSSGGEYASREAKERKKKLKKVDPNDSMSMWDRQTGHKKSYLEPTSFVREKWLKLRGLDQEGKFIPEDESKLDAWKSIIPADKLIKKYGGEIFSDTKIDEGLHSVVDKNETKEERELSKLQRRQGCTAHLSLKAMEGFARSYEKVKDFITYWIGYPADTNQNFDTSLPPSESNLEMIWSEKQCEMYSQGQELLKEIQVDIADPIANLSRVSAASFIDTLDKRREKVLQKIRRTNPSAATAINRIAPSASYMFGGDHSRLEKVVKLNRDLISTTKKHESSHHKSGKAGGSSSHHYKYGGGSRGGAGAGGHKSRGGYGHGGRGRYDKRDEKDRKFGGNSNRGGKSGN